MSQTEWRKYTEEFKIEAVRLVRKVKRPSPTWRENSVFHFILHRWRGEDRRARRPGTMRTALEVELGEFIRLRPELDR